MFYEHMWMHSPAAPLLDVMSETTDIPTIYQILQSPIDTISWSDLSGHSHLDKMMEIGRMRRPLLIQGAPCSHWKANRKWRLSQSPQDVMQYLSILHHTNNLHRAGVDPDSDEMGEIDPAMDIVAVHRMNGSNFFTFHDRTRPFMAQQMVNEETSGLGAMERVNVSFIDYLGYLHNRRYSALNTNRTTLYYHNSARNVYQDLKPMNWFKIRDRTVEFTDTLRRELHDINQINLDLSPSALFVNAHYEMAHSLFYQIEGSRRFLISPPSESLKLRSFPEGHPAYRSSQIPHKFYFIPMHLWISRKSHPFPPRTAKTKDRVKAWSVVLEPGDLLYVPPWYWTQITTLRTSIAVKSASLGFEQVFTALSDPAVLPRILRRPSLDDEARQKYVLHQLAFFTRHVIDRTLKALPDERDSDGDGEMVSEHNDELQWDTVHRWMREQLIRGRYQGNLLWDDMRCSQFDAVRCPIHGNSSEVVMQDMEQTAKTWAFAYKEMKQYVEDDEDRYHIRNLMMTTHIEQFVSYITGHSNYCYFIQCLINERFGSLYVESEMEAQQRMMREQMEQQNM